MSDRPMKRVADSYTTQVQVLTLEVRARNQDARRFYEALGFVPVGIRRGFYQNPPDDACLYQWKPED